MLGSRQLPVYSPLPARAVLAALGANDPREALIGSLRHEYAADDAVLTASGTVALTLALLAASARRPEAPVALPAYACYDLVTAAVGAGVRVVLYDLDPRTLTPEPASFEAALALGPAAIVVVHLFGVPVPMDAMRAAADRIGALLIEDAAQATGGAWQGRPLGAHGDVAVLSFGRGKGETGGGGGALLLRRGTTLPPEVRARLTPPGGGAVPFALKLAAQWALGRPSLYGIPASIPMLRLGETIYKDPPEARGLPAASARVLALTRPLAAREAMTRRANADAWRRALGSHALGVGIEPQPGGTPGWLRFPIRLRLSGPMRARGVALGLAPAYPLPLLALPALAPLVVHRAVTPGAQRLAERLSTLPTHSLLTAEARQRMVRWLADALADSPDA